MLRVQDFTLTLSGAAQRLSTVLGDPTIGGPDDTTLQYLALQPDGANGNPTYVGSSSAVSSSLYGVSLPAGTGGVPPLPYAIPLAQTRMRLSDVWVIGTAAQKLHILLVAY